MTVRLLAGAACVGISLLCVWVADPDSRDAASMGQGALWGLAGLLVVWVVRSVVRGR